MDKNPEESRHESRRSFLKWVTAGGLLVWTGIVGVPALGGALSPDLRRKGVGGQWVDLGRLGHFGIGGTAPTQVNFPQTVVDAWMKTQKLKDVWVYTRDDKHFRVYNGRCTHLGCRYGFDESRGVFRCPCHGGVYDVTTGAVLAGPPPRPLDTLRTKVKGSNLSTQYMDFRVGIPEKIPVRS